MAFSIGNPKMPATWTSSRNGEVKRYASNEYSLLRPSGMAPIASSTLVGANCPYQDRSTRSRSTSSYSARRQASVHDDPAATPFERAYCQREGFELPGISTSWAIGPQFRPAAFFVVQQAFGRLSISTTLARSSNSKYARSTGEAS